MNNLEEKCIKAGLKMTGQRRVILRVLEQAEDHPSVETVFERAREQNALVSMATVYRTLNLLDELGIVVRHDFKENFSRYELKAGHHDHLIDLESGEVVEFQDAALEEIKTRIAHEMGYELVDHRLELYGKRIRKT